MLYQVQVTVGSTGTAVPLSATRQSATWVQIQSFSANNTAGLTVGGVTVKPTVASELHCRVWFWLLAASSFYLL